jgi:hypothetical protein
VLLDELEGEVGELPPEVRNLADRGATRIACRELGVVRLSWLKVRCLLELHPASMLHGDALDALFERHPKRFVRRAREDRTLIEVRFTPREGERPLRYLRWVFTQLQNTTT